MPQTLNLRFHKKGQYDSIIFICSSDRESERDTYQMLSSWASKLQSLAPGSFLPIYHNRDFNYVTVRFKDYNFKELTKGLCKNDLCEIKFGLAKRKSKGKTYFNTILQGVKLIKKFTPVTTDCLDLDSLFGDCSTPPNKPIVTPSPSPDKTIEEQLQQLSAMADEKEDVP